MRKVLLLLFVIFSVSNSDAAEVKVVSWETSHAAPVTKIDEKQGLTSLIRLGVSAVPEAMVMQTTFIGGAALGLPPEKARSLHLLLSKRYQKIAVDKTFSKVRSALPYCYSATKPTSGYASVFLPEKANANSNVILFLHGYGGSFVFYQHYLADTFPDHIIVCPAYGISSSHVSSLYLKECMDAVAKELGLQMKRPVLIGLSAGGFGGFREYVRREDSYCGYICIAAYPPRDVQALIPRTGRIRVVAGGEESFVKNKELEKAENSIKQRLPDYSSHIIPNQDHFFMLSAEEETKKLLRKWDSELQAEK